ncbi:MAG: hypothetical protein JWL72_4484 [Ilumatobacteraceae bacterium]|nr:hypothetical protein [Ilumatobacteraceae bacterium]
MSEPERAAARYSFGDNTRAGLLLGLTVRQSIPIVVGVVWLTVCIASQIPLVGVLGPCIGLIISFGTWKRTPLYETASPAAHIAINRLRRRNTWVRTSLLGTGDGYENQVPAALNGLDVLAAEFDWANGPQSAGVVHDRPAGTVSVVVDVAGDGFAVASPREQDGMVSAWGAVLAPLARVDCPVSKLTWQVWTQPIGVDGHLEFLDEAAPSQQSKSREDYDQLLLWQAPHTVSHTVLLTLTVDMRQVRSRRRLTRLAASIEAVLDEARLLRDRLETAGVLTNAVLSPAALAETVRSRSDPTRINTGQGKHRSLSAATGRASLEWGPMAVEPSWSDAAVDGSLHRSYRVASWPMLPVGADWMAPLLTGATATRTVTMVLEPVALTRAAQEANRQLTSIEADRQQKEGHGFRLTARDRRRHADVESRERELAEGHPEFRHVGIVTVTASTLDDLDDTAAAVEQAAAQSMLDLRPLAARHVEGWVASLPLGRSVRQGRWT